MSKHPASIFQESLFLTLQGLGVEVKQDCNTLQVLDRTFWIDERGKTGWQFDGRYYRGHGAVRAAVTECTVNILKSLPELTKQREMLNAKVELKELAKRMTEEFGKLPADCGSISVSVDGENPHRPDSHVQRRSDGAPHRERLQPNVRRRGD